MRHAMGLLLAIAILGLFGLGESEAVCRAAGEYHLTGPNLTGTATLVETSDRRVHPRLIRGGHHDPLLQQSCPVCLVAPNTLTGQYHTAPSISDGTGPCTLGLNVVEAMTGRTGNVGGMLAFGGTVIMFGNYLSLGTVYEDLSLTLGIRSDSLLRP